MGKSSPIVVALAVSIAFPLFFSGLAHGQETSDLPADYDPEYDDEEAAGKSEYSDEEAAGALEYSDEEAAGAPVQPAPEQAGEPPAGEVSAGAQLTGEVLFAAEKEPGDRYELHTWEWGAHRHHSNLNGPTGLFHIAEAGSDRAGTFGIGVHGAYFYYTEYLIPKDENHPADENTYMWGDLNLRVTPIDFLEIYLSVQALANHNTREYPRLFQSLGDMEVGLKGFFSPVDWLGLGALFSAQFMNAMGEMAIGFEGTSFGIDLLSSFDIVEINESVPLRAHLNAGYLFDQSANLVEDLEDRRGGCGTLADDGEKVKYKGCLSPVERMALQINRNDQVRIGVGVDMALPYVTPLVEYRLEIPVNRQDFICPEIPDTLNVDHCMAQEGASAFKQVITFGTRVLLPVESLAIDVGVDVGLAGYAPTVHELAAVAPYRVIFGASYNFDPFPEEKIAPPPPPPPPPAPEPPPPPPAVIVGLVTDASLMDRPIPGAVITYLEQDLNPQIADRQGRFRSYPLPAGTVTISVSAEGFFEEAFHVTVPQTGEVKASCPLKEMPKKAVLAFHLTDETGQAVEGAAIAVSGPTHANVTTDASGNAELEVDAGSYQFTVEKEEYFTRRAEAVLELDKRSEVQISLSKRPKRARVLVRKKIIRIKQKIHFESGSAEIKPESFGLLDEIAEVLNNTPEITQVEIQGHTDNRGKAEVNLDLSDRRARSVRSYLMKAGVSSTRLTAKGYGSKKPKAPNVTSDGRARNRRVEFRILERSDK